jgi:hypothetical protein
MFTDFTLKKEAYEKEGVYIGGWSFSQAFFPKKTDGKHGKSLYPS